MNVRIRPLYDHVLVGSREVPGELLVNPTNGGGPSVVVLEPEHDVIPPEVHLEIRIEGVD